MGTGLKSFGDLPEKITMAETTNIEWADATLNFWIGCTAVSNGAKGACAHCYAETWGNRFGVKWGSGEPRRKTVGNLAKAMRVERKAIAQGKPQLCFSNSLSDIFDKEVPVEWLAEAFETMRATPHVIYLLLTKRPQNARKRSLEAGGLPSNAAIGFTAVTQAELERDAPFAIRAKVDLNPAFLFVSIEPMMGAMDISPYLHGAGIDWVIAGGESGPHARPTHADWIRSLRDQCASAQIPFLFKQWGEWLGYGVAAPADEYGNLGLPCEPTADFDFPDGERVFKVGKKAAGRLLDGVIHDARPQFAKEARMNR